MLSRCPPTSYTDPLVQAASLLTLYINNISVTLASTPNTIFFNWVPCFPIFVFFFSLLLVFCRHFQERGSVKLTITRSICRAMLYSCMSITNVTKVMDIPRSQKSPGSERMNGRVSPLSMVLISGFHHVGGSRLTLSIQKPPLLSIISKKSLYSLLLNQSSLAISKLLQK